MNLAIIQARMTSTRLPGKVMKEIGGEILLDIVIKRVSRAQTIDKVVVACTDNEADDNLVSHLVRNNVEYFRGSETNVLERFYVTAKYYNARNVVRITADDPLKEPSIIDSFLTRLTADSYDYVSNTIDPTYPEGLDVEVFSFAALEKAYKGSSLPSELEHVTPYIWKNKEIFSVCNMPFVADLSSWRWTVDKREDLIFFERIESALGSLSGLYYIDVICHLMKNPDLLAINSHIPRNEGYQKSVGEDDVNHEGR